MIMKYGDLRYSPREMARGVDLQFAGGEGGEGFLKDSDKLYKYVHCTVSSVASESLSNAPRSICPLVAPDLVRPSQGAPPPIPPTERSNTQCGCGGGVGVGVCGGGGGSLTNE